ncbi:MAG: cation-transporting P-type ATPase, partial [Microthrixaceae bacterium]
MSGANATAAGERAGGDSVDLAEVALAELPGALGCGLDGLSTREADQRLERHGRNEIPEPHRNALLKLLAYFWGPIPWMIEVALILSLVVRHWADAAIIGTLLVTNGIVGFWE